MTKKKKNIIKKTTETLSDCLGNVGEVFGGGISRAGSRYAYNFTRTIYLISLLDSQHASSLEHR